MLAFTTMLIDSASRTARALDTGGARSVAAAGLHPLGARLADAVSAARGTVDFLAAAVATGGPGSTERGTAVLDAHTAALAEAGRLLRPLAAEVAPLDQDLYTRLMMLVGNGLSALDGLVEIAAAGRLPLGPSTDELEALAWRSRGPDTAARRSRQSRMVAGGRGRWLRGALAVRGEWDARQRAEAARCLRGDGPGGPVADSEAALAVLRAELAARVGAGAHRT